MFTCTFKETRPATISFDSTTTVEEDPMHDAMETDGVEQRPSLASVAPKGSFSSLIDYDPSNASDKSHRPSASPPPDTEMEDVELNFKSKVELLRLRLRVAMYKVRTDQTLLPFSDLKMLSEFGMTEKSIRKDVSFKEPLPSPIRASLLNSLRAGQADGGQGRPNSLELLPAPVLLPTAYSARFVSGPIASVPSSPPSGFTSPRKDSMQQEDRITSLPATRVSSPYKAHTTPMARRILEEESEENLTSSVVKGRAANGLLELMRAC